MIYAGVAFAALFFGLIGWLYRSKPKAPQNDPQNWVLVDGSNVMYWADQTPKLEAVQEAVDLLASKGYVPCVMFDANAGYRLADGYKHDHEFAQMLGLPTEQVMVVNKGEQADLYLLKAARRRQARVVTNDMFRDWAKTYPEVRRRGHLVHGGYHKGKMWLDLDGSRPRAGKSRPKRS